MARFLYVIIGLMKNLHYAIWKEGKYYVARSLEVEVASQGKTRKEAIASLQEALELRKMN